MMIAQFNVIIRDAKGRTGRVLFYVDVESYPVVGSDALEAISGYLTELVTRLDKIIKGAIISTSLSIALPLPAGVRALPDETSDIEESALFEFPALGGFAEFRHSIPTFNHEIFPQGTSRIDTMYTTDADLFAYANLIANHMDDPDWGSDEGGLSDARGDAIGTYPVIEKRFKRS